MNDRPTASPAAPPRRQPLKFGDIILLWVALVAWTTLFVAGTLVDSEPYRQTIAATGTPLWPDLLRAALVVVGTYTLTNVAVLCVLAAILGTLGRRAQIGTDAQPTGAYDSVSPRSSAVLRGFVVYLTLISGVLVFGEDPAQPSQTQYVRLAGFASLTSFVLNWDPRKFVKVLQGALDRLGKDDSGRDGGDRERRAAGSGSAG